MSYKVEVTAHFKKEAKRLVKKYQSLKTELSILFDELSENPTIGTPLGSDIYKVRLAITSKGKGKSGGARVITYVKVNEITVVLLSIYSKGEKDTISDEEIQQLMKQYLL